ncbi:MAG: alanine racemase [Holosporaceae bacterium]|jgi:alanine racemase|nr:alanine racemase [Holosporaceae bacterium]
MIIKNALKQVPPHILSALVINLDNVAENYRRIKNEVSEKVQVIAVIKADAYGLGAIPIGKKLYKEGCRAFFVATIEEGIQVREAVPVDARIFILSGLLEKTEDLLIQHKLIPVVNNIYQMDLWINHAKKINKKLDVVVHIDTGMARNGCLYRDVKKCRDRITDNLNVIYIMSHLACADVPDTPLNKLQLERFQSVMQTFEGAKGCLSATNGIFLQKDYFFDAVRPGKALYGFSIREDKIGCVVPVADIFSRIVQINCLSPGDTVGYGATFTADCPMTTITIGFGYADGLMRKFSGFGHGFFGGKILPMVGRISMDYVVLDASEVDESYLKMGEWVALTRNPDYTLEKWALELNTLPHEVACRFGPRVKKVYLEKHG